MKFVFTLTIVLVLSCLKTNKGIAQTLDSGAPTLRQPSTNPAGDKGLRWTTDLSWQQVKEKAKGENKYIFIDAFATWCGPCKKMEKEVYPNDSLGNYFNDKFISIKVQMDKTNSDNAFIQSWYEDAAAINKQYRIQGYPTLIFLSPEGKIVHQVLGYQSVRELVAAAETATKPGQVYLNPYAEYDSLVEAYKGGNKNYDRMPFMIRTAYQLGENDFGKQLLQEHTDYVATLPKEKRYTKENIELWSGFTLLSSSQRFKFFYNDGDFIDSVMHKRGYANRVIDNTINYEVVDSFFKTQHGGAVMTSESTNPLFRTREDDKADKAEANWDKLYKMLIQKFRVADAKRNLINAKLYWYQKHNNYTSSLRTYQIRLKELPPDFSNEMDRISMNRFAFDVVFMKFTDVKVLLQFCDLMKKCLVEEEKEQKENASQMDTYANLLYKAGKFKDAFHWEEKAVELAKNQNPVNADFYREIWSQMKKRQPTNLDGGANWQRVAWVNWAGALLPKVIYVQDEHNKPVVNAVVTVKRTGESKLTDQTYKDYGYTVVEHVYAGDVLLVSKNGYTQQEVTVGKNPWAIVVALKKSKSN